MDTLQAIILGIVQGLTEFLPISSSAHLVIVPWLLGWPSPSLTFDVALHMGTLVAVLVYFFRDWVGLIRGFIRSIVERRFVDREPERKLSWFILIGTIPAAIAGLLGGADLENNFHSNDPQTQANAILIIALVMMALAALLFIAERVATHRLQLKDLTLPSSLLIGIAQAFALIPGVSRSGSTITAGLFVNLRREDAARYSFLLGTPAIIAAGAKSLYDIIKPGSAAIPSSELTSMLIGAVISAVVGFAAIAFLLGFLRRNSTLPFIVYRVALGVVLIALVLIGFRR